MDSCLYAGQCVMTVLRVVVSYHMPSYGSHGYRESQEGHNLRCYSGYNSYIRVGVALIAQ